MTILITGGAGYIGSHVALNLIDAGYKVTIIDDLSTGNKNLIPNNAEFIKCNINELEKIDSLLKKKKFSAIMHFAGFVSTEESIKFPKKYFENNTNNSEKLFDVCISNKLSNIIFSSTAAVYGDSGKNNIISETTQLKPLNPYGESKFKAEQYLLKQNPKNVTYIILRYFNVAGADPKLRSGLISKNPTHLIKKTSEAATSKRDSITIFGNNYDTYDGTAIRDYIHVSDLADIHIKAFELLIKEKRSEIINCGYGKGYSVKEVLNMANLICGNKIKIINGPRRTGDAQILVSDISKLKQLIDWTPKYNKLDFIIKSSIDWELKLLNEKFL